ncbi:MAG: DUF4864 domain-containing protein [Verrucomicrobiota bacterium]|nr:DUF4864 domain-containing protein [Verrucomicrobiota bacterium]
MSRWLKISVLLFFFALCGVAMVITHRHRQETPAPAPRELYSIVNRQLSDLRSDDFDSAYRRAASGVQQKFSREQFELMIRRDFSSMTQAQRIEFGTVQAAGGVAYAQVYLTTPDGARRGYLYSFTAEAGGWKIDGVQPIGPQSARRGRGLPL